MDEGLNQAVKEVFVDLFDKGLIYKGKKIVNWSPKAQSTVSDEEVNHKDVQDTMYTLRYHLATQQSGEYAILLGNMVADRQAGALFSADRNLVFLDQFADVLEPGERIDAADAVRIGNRFLQIGGDERFDEHAACGRLRRDHPLLAQFVHAVIGH